MTLLQSEPQAIAALENTLTTLNCIESPLQVSKLLRERPEELMLVICVLIEELVFALNVPTLTDAQVAYIAKALVHKFWFFKVEDFILCFRNIKYAAYGNIYNRLDVHTICQFCQRYDADRTSEIEQMRIWENHAFKTQKKEADHWDYEAVKQAYFAKNKPYDDMSEEERKNFRIAQKRKMFGFV